MQVGRIINKCFGFNIIETMQNLSYITFLIGKYRIKHISTDDRDVTSKFFI